MKTTWAVVVLVGAATIAIKAAGPLLAGKRPMSPRVAGVLALLAPALLAALVATQVFGGDRQLVVDARLPGVAAAGVALFFRAHLLVVVGVAATTTALVRLL